MTLVLQVIFIKWGSEGGHVNSCLFFFERLQNIYCEHAGMPSHVIDVSLGLAFPILNKE